jgi:hypothetical protein
MTNADDGRVPAARSCGRGLPRPAARTTADHQRGQQSETDAAAPNRGPARDGLRPRRISFDKVLGGSCHGGPSTIRDNPVSPHRHGFRHARREGLRSNWIGAQSTEGPRSRQRPCWTKRRDRCRSRTRSMPSTHGPVKAHKLKSTMILCKTGNRWVSPLDVRLLRGRVRFRSEFDTLERNHRHGESAVVR